MSATVTPTPSASSAALDKLAAQSSASEAMKSLSSAISSASAALSAESKIAAGSLALPSFMKDLGIALAVGSGVLIGTSFVFKKKGLLSAQKKYNTEAGESMAYLKSPLWWLGMSLMILGEVLNLIAYAVTSAVLVTPLGALSVVISAILSSIFLKEKLTLFGKIGCFLCIVGSTIIALNAPEQHAAGEIKQFQKMFLSVGFLVWGSLCIVAALCLIFFVAPRFGKRYMLVYISVCSLIGGLSVSTISGVGSAIVLSIQGVNQFKHWFLYFLIGFVIITLVTEIIYLNKALELFNTAMVTPTYYVLFTFATLITSIVLFQGLDASAVQIVTIVFGFLTICAGITLLQLSKIDPDDLVDKETYGMDRTSTLLIRASRSQIAHEKGHTSAMEDPGIDTVRGGLGVIGSIVRARSSRRLHASADEYHQMADEHGHLPHSDTMHSLNTLGKRDMERYELHDRPMPGSPSAAPHQYLTLPALHLHMPTKRDTVISFVEGSEEPHGHHRTEKRSETADSRGSKSGGSGGRGGGSASPTLSARGASGTGGGILLSPTSSAQGHGVTKTRMTAEPTALDGIIERTATTTGSAMGPRNGPSTTSIRVVGPRQANSSSSSSGPRDLRKMWHPAQDGDVAPAPSPGAFDDDISTDYLASTSGSGGGGGGESASSESNDTEQTASSIAVRRKGGASRGVLQLHATKDGAGANDDDEAEELLSPPMRSAQTFVDSTQDSGSHRSARDRRR